MSSDTEIEILLVEDNPRDAELALSALRTRHVANRIVHVQDGQAALDWLFGTGDQPGCDPSCHPKLVLLDLKMPKVDGIEVLRAIRADPRTKKMPVVVMTSSKEERDLIESYKLGVNSFVVKPMDFHTFSDAVAMLGQYWLLVNQEPLKQ